MDYGGGLVVDVLLLRLPDDQLRGGGTLPALDFDVLAFEVLVDRKEVGNLFQDVGVDVGILVHIVVARISFAYTEDLFVALTLVDHLEYADGADLLDAAGKAGGIDQHEHVERIAVVAEGAGNEAVVARVMHRRKEVPVEAEDVQILVVLVLANSLQRDLDYGIHQFRRLRSDGQGEVIRHILSVSLLDTSLKTMTDLLRSCCAFPRQKTQSLASL